jgi:hypothetical protein
MIPNGRYEATAVNAILGETKGGKMQLEVIWEIAEGDHIGAQVSSMHYFTGEAKAWTLAMMAHAGCKDNDLDTLRGKCSITLYDDEYKGEVRQKVRVNVPNPDGIQTPENKRKSASAAKTFLDRLTSGNGGGAFDGVDSPPDMPGDDAKPGSDDPLPF